MCAWGVGIWAERGWTIGSAAYPRVATGNALRELLNRQAQIRVCAIGVSSDGLSFSLCWTSLRPPSLLQRIAG